MRPRKPAEGWHRADCFLPADPRPHSNPQLMNGKTRVLGGGDGHVPDGGSRMVAARLCSRCNPKGCFHDGLGAASGRENSRVLDPLPPPSWDPGLGLSDKIQGVPFKWNFREQGVTFQ